MAGMHIFQVIKRVMSISLHYNFLTFDSRGIPLTFIRGIFIYLTLILNDLDQQP